MHYSCPLDGAGRGPVILCIASSRESLPKIHVVGNHRFTLFETWSEAGVAQYILDIPGQSDGYVAVVHGYIVYDALMIHGKVQVHVVVG